MGLTATVCRGEKDCGTGVCAPNQHNANLNLQVNGPTVSVEPVHAKIRRSGYAGDANAKKIG
ncbi:hypothetical protein FrEUN1fDRAFT_3553 [Parafrankia sp. EUN1f]|nr:hypothetical protein FrEUN1fDRAFT_3553 [Parafrankia sp. EUN1f]